MKTIIIMALCVLMVGCSHGTRFSFDDARQVKVGMTEQQVIDIMGKPYQINSQQDGEIWTYFQFNTFDGAKKQVSYFINNGKVSVIPKIAKSLDDI